MFKVESKQPWSQAMLLEYIRADAQHFDDKTLTNSAINLMEDYVTHGNLDILVQAVIESNIFQSAESLLAIVRFFINFTGGFLVHSAEDQDPYFKYIVGLFNADTAQAFESKLLESLPDLAREYQALAEHEATYSNRANSEPVRLSQTGLFSVTEAVRSLNLKTDPTLYRTIIDNFNTGYANLIWQFVDQKINYLSLLSQLIDLFTTLKDQLESVLGLSENDFKPVKDAIEKQKANYFNSIRRAWG